MVVGVLKRLFYRYNDSGPILHITGIEYEEALKLNREDVSFDLNGEVPKLYIKGQEVGVVSMTNHYVTRDDIGRGSSTTTFMYMVNGHPDHKVLSINQTTGEVFNQ